MDALDFWFPWQPALYRQDTLNLTAEQDGIYRRLIDWYMENAQPLPDNMVAIARIAGVGPDAMSNAWSMLGAYFEHAPGIGWRHEKCENVLLDMKGRSEKRVGKAKVAAQARWKKHRKNNGGDAPSMPQAMLGDATKKKKKTQEGDKSPTPQGAGDLPDKQAQAMRLAEKLAALATADALIDWMEYCQTHGITCDIPLELERFTQYCLCGKGRYIDHKAAFRNWLLKLKGDTHGNGNGRTGGGASRGPSKSERFKRELTGGAQDLLDLAEPGR